MQKKTVKRCVRPQCMEIYEETDKNRFCICGALLQMVELDIKSKKNAYEKSGNTVKSETNSIFEQNGSQIEVNNEQMEYSESKAFLYLLLDDDDIEFELSNITRIGRAAVGVQVDIDLTEYAGKDVSREHAVIQKEKDGYYITNVSRNHSVRIMDCDDNEVAIEYGRRALLKTGDGIILSRKVLLQFEEEE